ncbi:MAG: tetratricopeptide repeat protein [Pseudomonadota bacterium]|nr:tetratricopeptide repeat protein [Pseudomonadota bacterium]
MRNFLILASLSLLAAAPVSAQDRGEIGYPQGSLGFDALIAGDLRTAELQLRAGPAAKDDPAVLLNLGQIYVTTGRTEEAEAAFRRVLGSPNVELVLASGREMSSHRAASLGLRSVARTASR